MTLNYVVVEEKTSFFHKVRMIRSNKLLVRIFLLTFPSNTRCKSLTKRLTRINFDTTNPHWCFYGYFCPMIFTDRGKDQGCRPGPGRAPPRYHLRGTSQQQAVRTSEASWFSFPFLPSQGNLLWKNTSHTYRSLKMRRKLLSIIKCCQWKCSLFSSPPKQNHGSSSWLYRFYYILTHHFSFVK